MNNEKFKEYLKIQQSGVTNMFDVNKVIQLSKNKLDREDCIDIMKNYNRYLEIHNKIENNEYDYLTNEV